MKSGITNGRLNKIIIFMVKLVMSIKYFQKIYDDYKNQMFIHDDGFKFNQRSEGKFIGEIKIRGFTFD